MSRVACLVLACLVTACATRTEAPIAQLFERYPEQWGLRAGTPIALAGVALVTTVGKSQAFTPSVFAARSLSHVNLYLTLPPGIDVAPSPIWAVQRRDGELQTYSTHLGPINAGERINASEIFFFTPRLPGRLAIGYIITAQELPAPVRGRVWIEAQ